MDKRYQVFVSSTYEDLQTERQEVMHALLELDCIPAGMELFPAANEEQWSLIKKVITDCDYYIVIVAGRYGSIGNDGISYTEMEYRHAIEIGKPVIAFLHKDPNLIPAGKTEKSEEGKRKLAEFRKLVENKMCKYWKTPEELGSVVSRSLIKLIKSNPAIGWIKADIAVNQDAMKEIISLRKKIIELEKELNEITFNPPKGTEDLAQGNDELKINYTFKAVSSSSIFKIEGGLYNASFKTTWNKIFSVISPSMINEISNNILRNIIDRHIKDENYSRLKKDKKFEYADLINFSICDEDFNTIKVQFRALGLIKESIKNRSLKEVGTTFWTLTPYGDALMTKLRAIKK